MEGGLGASSFEGQDTGLFGKPQLLMCYWKVRGEIDPVAPISQVEKLATLISFFDSQMSLLFPVK